jgi:F-type H+-transporting ATPase subunit b
MSPMKFISECADRVPARRYLVAVIVLSLLTMAAVTARAQQNSSEKSAVGNERTAAAQHAATEAQKPEAEKSEDEDAQFKHSASVQWIARHLKVSTDTAYWISVLVNFAIVAVLVGLFLKKKLPVWAQQRTAAIQKGMEEARRTSEDANRRLSEIEDRLSRLDTEIAQLQATAALQGDEEEARQKAAADEEQRRMIEAAEQEIGAAANAARRDLKAYCAELAVSLAEKRIKVDAATDQELVRDFVDQLGRNGRQ